MDHTKTRVGQREEEGERVGETKEGKETHIRAFCGRPH